MARPFLILSAFALCALASCCACDQIPDRTELCTAETLIPAEGFPDGGRSSCIACIEDTPCCDAVGRCKDDETCTEAFRRTHECILDAGGSRAVAQEGECLTLLRADDAGDSLTSALYTCMRQTCGAECALPICRLDPSIPFAGTPECDDCFALSCCEEFNACAKNRACRLALECIVEDCRDELDRTLDPAASAAEDAFEREACDGVPAPRTGPPEESCTNRCIATHLGGLGPPTTDEIAASRCLALRVRSCGARAACGPKCKQTADAAVADGDTD